MNTMLIARREILDHLLSAKFYVVLVATVLLVGLSVGVMYRDYQVRLANYAVLKERAKPRPGESGVMAVVEPRALSVVAKGLDELMDRGYTITAYMGVDTHDRQTKADSLFSLFAAPDLLYIVKVLLSLVALLFAYDAVSGERERGTLKLILGNAVSRAELVAGKMLGGLAVIVVPFVGVLLVALLVLSMQPGIAFGAAEYGRLALMLLATLLYVTLFYALGVLVSALARQSAGALVVLLFAWAVIVFALPNVGTLVAEQIAPLPSGQSLEMARMQAFAKNRFLEIQEYGANNRGQRVVEFDKEYDRLMEQYHAKLNRQIAASKSISRITPAASLSYIFTDLAGTGVTEQRRLSRALLDFKSRNFAALRRSAGPDAPKLSVFEFPPQRLGQVVRSGFLVDLTVLALMTAALFTAAVLMFVRTDPR
jgi:ABC-type transport system involved in multi-copper enzyme maturation permease subunit